MESVSCFLSLLLIISEVRVTPCLVVSLISLFCAPLLWHNVACVQMMFVPLCPLFRPVFWVTRVGLRTSVGL